MLCLVLIVVIVVMSALGYVQLIDEITPAHSGLYLILITIISGLIIKILSFFYDTD